MVDQRLREALASYCEEAGLGESEQPIILDSMSYDGSIVGLTEGNRLVYSMDSMVEELMEDEGWTYEEAVEWLDYNTLRAIPYMGDHAPIVISETRESLIERHGPAPEPEGRPAWAVPESEADPIVRSLGLTEERVAELASKRRSVSILSAAMSQAAACGAAFGSAERAELRLYACPSASGAGEWRLEEYLAIGYRGGAMTFRRASHNSLSANFQEAAKLINGGYYDELDEVARMSESGYLVEFAEGGAIWLRKPGKEDE